MNFIKKHHYLLIFFGSLFLIFLWPLLVLKKTFVSGDYWEQFYPWMYHYARCLMEGRLPYWTDLIANGFPLVAEGQIGAYYPFHLLFYRVLPFFTAYTWQIPLHIAIGGIGFYLYSRKIGMQREGATLAAVIFSFSSGYGGCFYTTGALRVLTWLPYLLLAGEFYSESRGKKFFRWVSLGAVFVFLMSTGGFPQLALYAVGYLFLLALFSRSAVRAIAGLILSLAVGLLLALPQIFQTMELAKWSAREGQGAGFALWGSVPPPALISLILPEWGSFVQVAFYVGLIPFAFAIGMLKEKKSRIKNSHLLAVVIFALLAFGRYNPVYAFMVEKLSFTMVRNPSKFLFFSGVSLGVLAGLYFDRLTADSSGKLLKDTRKILGVFAGILAGLPLLVSTAYWIFKDVVRAQLPLVAERIYAGKIERVHDLAYYERALNFKLDQIRSLCAVTNPWNLVMLAIALGGCAAAHYCLKFQKPHRFRYLVCGLIILDLSIFGFHWGTGFINNSKSVPPPLKITLLDKFQKLGAIKPDTIAEFVSTKPPGLIPASTNMLYDLRQVGGYSPLLLKRYYELTKEFGFTDCSLGRYPVLEAEWAREKQLLDALGATKILSDCPLPKLGMTAAYTLALSDRVATIYPNTEALPDLYIAYNWKVIQNREERLRYLKSGDFKPTYEVILEAEPVLTRSGALSVSVAAPQAVVIRPGDIRAAVRLAADGILVFRNSFFPRWKIEVDGRSQPLIIVNHAFMGVCLPKGAHTVKFYYDAAPLHLMETLSVISAILIVFINLYLFRVRK